MVLRAAGTPVFVFGLLRPEIFRSFCCGDLLVAIDGGGVTSAMEKHALSSYGEAEFFPWSGSYELAFGYVPY